MLKLAIAQNRKGIRHGETDDDGVKKDFSDKEHQFESLHRARSNEVGCLSYA